MQALWFLIDTITSFLVSSLLLRGYMNWLGLRGRDPLSQFVVAITDWCVLPLRKLIPPRKRWDLASFVAAFLLALIAALLFTAMAGHGLLSMIAPALLLAVGWLIKWALTTAMVLLILSAILSWVNPQAPMAPALDTLTSPMLDPIRRLVPLVGGIDLSPLIAILGIQFLLMVSQNLLSGRIGF